jgi:DNA polymerase I-like protein with 3'-5' exonuclease and polymerase domains
MMIVLDFETKAIRAGAPLLPLPVGCAILDPDRYPEGHYFSWGHPEGNNCTKEEFRDYLVTIWDKEILTQNGCTFDIPVAAHHFNLPPRDPLLTHDTLFASYLHNPHARSLSLKDLADDWLGIPPDEQQDMYDWIMANVPECRSRSECGAYISEAPASLVGPYAIGDCTRTLALWNYVSDKIKDMEEPYQREIMLGPILADIQNGGIRCDIRRLAEDYLVAMRKMGELDAMIREYLNAPTLQVSSDNELGIALKQAGYSGFQKTGPATPLHAQLEEYLCDAHWYVYVALAAIRQGQWRADPCRL